MVWNISAAVIAEGSTDDRFLEAVLSRMLEDLCFTEFSDMFEIGDVVAIRRRPGPSGPCEMVKFATENLSFSDFFFHHDHGSSADRVEREWLKPLRSAIKAAPVAAVRDRSVIVVPKVETEAWMLADVSAIAEVTGLSVEPPQFGLVANPADVETIPDPKYVLEQIGDAVSRNVGDYYARLGEIADLKVLGQVPSFRSAYLAFKDNLLAVGVG